MTPFIADFYDFALLFMAALVRFMFAINAKIKEKKENFDFAKYFDPRHLVRWVGHLITASTFLLFVPELWVDYIAPKYLPELAYWSFAGDFALGFAGYDLVKIAEKITSPILEKIAGRKI